MSIKNYLLQNEIPTNEWLTKDDNKEVIRSVSTKVADVNNLSKDEELTMKKLIDFVVASQDEEFNYEGKEDYLRPAVGLAAPQIGVNKDMFYIRFNLPNNQIEEYAMINTEYLAKSSRMAALEEGEGCLSVDEDKHGIVPRSWIISVKGFDWLKKEWVELKLKDYRSIVFQHEMDHNIGNLYYDHINVNEPEFIGEDWVVL
ncbi:polypeptide deformylase [Mesoplasma florum L1]|uniref:Peptide deformylase n=1 Tax=Mesoplasma florum (strain ATCC 33453 / NBRC 100688 / NCTC 11704 / L1) TaxID=265311 RepID=Q6F0P6_MESFL|nr:peptide deformylase [Mesoplasma florum]AAT75927.1 polypeptide deformylase [Mesoplasma florum L1]ATI73533.1 peptide deformylase [Mesoplasma florum]ATI74222.1 peptide deformylase [Mesoplasma florum]AVN59178.1 peptide deformylase [Mesoplasma florum]AVN61232.1 peptide deformylase [Mesoplasma florum]